MDTIFITHGLGGYVVKKVARLPKLSNKYIPSSSLNLIPHTKLFSNIPKQLSVWGKAVDILVAGACWSVSWHTVAQLF